MKFKLITFVCVALDVLFYHHALSLPSVIKIGGLFDNEDEEQELAFKIAVDWINENEYCLLPKSKLEAHVERLVPGDSYDASKKVCGLLGTGVAAVFGPQSAVTSMHVGSVCDEFEVPHVETLWDPYLHRDNLAINLHPNPHLLSRIYVNMVKYLGWQNFTLLYEENEGILRLKNFLKEADYNGWNIQIYKFDETKPFRSVIWQMKKDLRKLGYENQKIVLDVSRQNLYLALKHAQQVGMVTEHQQYLITNLDLQTFDLEDFRYSKTNITGFRLDQENMNISCGLTAKNLVKHKYSYSYDMLLQEIMKRQPYRGQMFALRAETTLMFDAVWTFATALQDLDIGKEVQGFPPIFCNESAKESTDGTSLINYMKSSTSFGITGRIFFDGLGLRSMNELNIMHLTEEGLLEIGSYEFLDDAVKITRSVPSETSIQHRHYIITTIEGDPYVMLHKSPTILTGNSRFEGFCIDLIEELSKVLHFSYEIRRVADRQYGTESKEWKGKWSGMIGEVMRGEAHMAVAGLSINSKREAAVDFTMPFMNTGISILFKKPTQTVKSLFSFLSPFSSEVWIYLMLAFFCVSIVTFFVGRLTPYEWINPHPCRQDDIVVENIFNIRNSMWFMVGSLMQQGSDLIPTAFCTRTAASFWNFFTLIMVSSYTANLAAFLTIEKVVYPIESAEDLAKQPWPPKVKFGCLSSGTTKQFFEDSSIETYKKMWTVMQKDSSVFAETNTEGKKKVQKGNYAFFMESATIEYLTERKCDLTQIGGLLDSKGYGIAVKKGNWEMVSWLNSGILKLQEGGVIHTLKEKWWKQKGGGKCRASSQSSGSVRELGLTNVGGVFVVLIFGLGIAILIALFEYWWKTRQYINFGQKEFWKMVMKELKFALSCDNTTKIAPQKKTTPTRSSISLNSRFSAPSQATS